MRQGWKMRSKESQMHLKPEVRAHYHRNKPVTITTWAVAQLRLIQRRQWQAKTNQVLPQPVTFVTDPVV